MKVCGFCKLEKERTEYNKNKTQKDGLQDKCRECQHSTALTYRKKNRAAKAAYDRKYQSDNKERLNSVKRTYAACRKANDPAYALLRNLRTRVSQAMDGRGKDAPTIELLGCTADQFREHVESQFVDGMGWSQRGLWHLDHSLPISAFDLAKPKHQRYAFHWSNCQPMWAEDNLRKSDKHCQKELKKFLASTLMEYSLKKKDEKR